MGGMEEADRERRAREPGSQAHQAARLFCCSAVLGVLLPCSLGPARGTGIRDGDGWDPWERQEGTRRPREVPLYDVHSRAVFGWRRWGMGLHGPKKAWTEGRLGPDGPGSLEPPRIPRLQRPLLLTVDPLPPQAGLSRLILRGPPFAARLCIVVFCRPRIRASARPGRGRGGGECA